nr:hypothetical protein [Protofrankia symbiont of Coriaria ruscifolia]
MRAALARQRGDRLQSQPFPRADHLCHQLFDLVGGKAGVDLPRTESEYCFFSRGYDALRFLVASHHALLTIVDPEDDRHPVECPVLERRRRVMARSWFARFEGHHDPAGVSPRTVRRGHVDVDLDGAASPAPQHHPAAALLPTFDAGQYRCRKVHGKKVRRGASHHLVRTIAQQPTGSCRPCGENTSSVQRGHRYAGHCCGSISPVS